MYDVLAWMEASALGRLMRESGPWMYAWVNLAHILGIAALFGSILVLDLRLLGLWRRAPLSTLSEAVVPVATAGFGIAVITGIALLATKATEYAGNPFFLIKLPAVAVGALNVIALRRSSGWRAHRDRDLSPAERRRLVVAGGLSLGCWLTVITAGRMIAYW